MDRQPTLDGAAAREPPTLSSSAMTDRVRAFDWARTPLGPREGWPPSLRTAVGICLGSPFPTSIWWGPELTLIYNDAYASLLGGRHPDALGRSGRAVWAEAWPEIAPLIESVVRGGDAVARERHQFSLQRNGGPEEAFFTYSFSPIPDEEGTVGGVLNVAQEDTAQMLAQRERERLAEQGRPADERARTILESITDSFFSLDREWRFTYLNPQALRVLDRTPEQMLGGTIWDLYPGLHGSEFERAYRRTAAERVSTSFTAHYPDHDRWYEVHAYPASDGGLAVYFRDVTERERAEQAMRATEALNRAVLAALDEGISVHDERGTIVMANASAERILGLTNDQLRGLDSFDPRWGVVAEDGSALPGEDHPPQAALRTGEPLTNLVMGINRADGTRVWVSANAMPLRDPATGGITGVVSSFFDITDRKRVEQDRADLLARAEHQARVFDATLSSVRDYVFLFDRDGRFAYANKALLDLWGLPPERALGRTMRELQYPSHVEAQLWGNVRRVFDTGQAVTDETAYTSPTNTTGYFEYILSPVLGEDGRTVMVAGTSRDITDRRRAELERAELLTREQAARAEAEQAGRMKDEFLATLSHELRTPLNAILGWSQIIRASNGDPADVGQGMEVIERNARAQSQIIEDLLDMSRIISGKVRLDVQRLDLSASVQAAVTTARPTAEAKGVRLLSIVDPLHGVVVTGDANRLQQVLWNLLSNAVKFTPKGGRVQVLLERVNSHVEVSVIDTGEGIRPEFLPFVFDRFRQADASTTRRHGGLGLGLSIVKQLVELHGGSVRVKSAGPGHGTTFVVALPLTVAQPDAEGDVERRHPRATPTLGGLPDACVEVAGLRVLVVDDEADARAMVQRLLQDCHAVVTITGSVGEAVGLVRSRQFDVLVSDIGMPGEDGYALIRRVRALGADQGGDIPAIALTAYARTEDRVKAVAAGFGMHVAKPVEPVELVTMVAGAAGRTGRTNTSSG